jgi:hypothetical protein
MKNILYKKGFTLFFALLTASLALAIGLAIYDITLRELTLSEVATQSQYAVYAADSGAECALYWDNKYTTGNTNGGSNSAFATSSADNEVPITGGGVICGGQDIVAAGSWPQASDASDATTTFMLGTVGSQAPCASVYVYKSGSPSITNVVSYGYNTCATGELQLERVFKVSY